MMMKISLRLYPSIPEFLGVSAVLAPNIGVVRAWNTGNLFLSALCFPFSLLSPPSSTFLFAPIPGISVEAGFFCYVTFHVL